jgi:hypothetical protein
MRSATPFDTHTYVRKLVSAGVPEPQAEAHASALAEVLGQLLAQLATKLDLDLLRQEFRVEVKELELRIAERLRSQMLWFFAIQGGLLAIAVAFIKFVPGN